MLKILLTATVQSHICQFHKPLVEMLREHGEVSIHVAAKDNLSEKNGLRLDFADKTFDVCFSRSVKSIDNFKAYKQLIRIISEGDYDIIHCNTPMGSIVTRLAARKARKKGTKVFYTAHGFHFYKGAPIKNWLLFYPIEKLFARKTDKLITVNCEDYRLAQSSFSCESFHIHGVGVSSERYFPVTASEREVLYRKLRLDANKKYILCVGELLKNKNQSLAINAMYKVTKRFPEAVLLIAGNGIMREELESLVDLMGLKHNVMFLGYCTNLEEYQRICDIAVSCSLREGLPLNLIEAMMTCNPIVASMNRGHNELVNDGQNGFLVDPYDSDAFAEALIKILDDADMAKAFGEKGAEIAKRYYSENVKKELQNIYFAN